jgi:hypothetical protein
VAETGDVHPQTAVATRFVALEALRITIGRPPVWLLVLSLELVLALPPALAYHGWMSGTIAHRYEPGSLFGNLDASFRQDKALELQQLDAATSRMGAVLVLFSMLIGCFCAGGWLQVFLERTRGESLRRFFLGGARYFWRFFRLLLLSMCVLALVTWILHGLPWNEVVLHWMFGVPRGDFQALESLGSEITAERLRFVQSGLHAALFGLVLVWGDYTRTRLALHDTSSALWAGLCTWWTIFRHPVRTLRPMIGLFAIEIAIVLVLGWLARSVEADIVRRPETFGVGILFATAQFALLWRVILRGARYHAAVQVSRDVVMPIARPDPWKASVGGPGGPRYPIGGDEYSVSI